MKRLIGLTALSATLVACGGADTGVGRLSGSGATFPAPFYTRTFSDYYKQTGNQINYQATGSGSGVRQFNANTIDFGATDKAVKDSQMEERGMVHIPIVGGAIVPAYNKQGCDLKLKQTQLVDVYLGKIVDWKDLGCEAGKILPVYRSDGSGTTAGFTNWTTIYPLDVIRTRQITYKNTLYETIKMGSLWKGYNACLLRAIITASTGFTIYEYMLKLMKD